MKQRIISILLAVCLLVSILPQISAEEVSIPSDAVEFNGNHYKIYDDSMTWTEAKAQCESMGGRLVTITSQKEMDFLIGMLAGAQKNCYWIGLEYLMDEGRWQMVNGTSVPYFNWAPNEPNFFNGNKENYVHLFGKRYTGGNGIKEVGDWNDVSNEGAAYANHFYALENFGYICEWGEETVASIDDLVVGFNDHYYKLYHHTETWEDAKVYCESVGGHLATITSQEENDFLYQLMKDRSVGNAYFGLTDAGEEGTWRWVTDEPLEYTNWGGSEPNSEGGNENYGMFYYKYTTGEWNDGNFGQGTSGDNFPVHFICEWEEEPSGDDLLVKHTPTGYHFYEDSYSFNNNSASSFMIARKCFTTMFGEGTGKLLYKKYKNISDGGVCFGMAYTTAAIYNGHPEVKEFVNSKLFGGDENCSVIRDLTLSARTKIGKNSISLSDYIKYSHIYQLSSAVAETSEKRWDDVAGLKKAVEDALADDQISVTIGMTHYVTDDKGERKSDGGHRVLAVGMDGNDILIDDPNCVDGLERLTINDDNSWSYSGAWTLDGVDSTNSRIRYQTDVTAPYNCLYTGTSVTTSIKDGVQPMTDHEEITDSFVEGMDRLDIDKMLCSIDGEGYRLSNTNTIEIILDIPTDSENRLYWICDDKTVSVSDLPAKSEIALGTDNLLMTVDVSDRCDIEMTNELDNANILFDTSAGSECTICLDTTGTDGQDVVLTITGSVSDGTVILDQRGSDVDIMGLDDGIITLTKNDRVVAEKELPDLEEAIHLEYDPKGNDDDVKISFTNPFTDVPDDSFYYESVMWAVENGITNGATETTFNPGGTCLRAQVVTFLHRAAGNPDPTSSNNPFNDVKPGDFFYQPVLWAVEKGITNGTSATAFGAYANCNRAAVVTFLWRAAGEPEPASTKNPFVDVKTTDFFYKPVLWAIEEGITNGVDATHFGPTADCNRAQVVTFLYRAYN